MVSTHPIWAHTDFASFYYLVNLDYYYVYCYAVYSNDILKYNVDIYYIYIYCVSILFICYFHSLFRSVGIIDPGRMQHATHLQVSQIAKTAW